MSRENQMNDTLCWECANAVPDLYGKRGCTWSRRFEPVEGWVAKKVHKASYDHVGGDSYHVIKCPMFVQDRTEVKKIRPIIFTDEIWKRLKEMKEKI